VKGISGANPYFSADHSFLFYAQALNALFSSSKQTLVLSVIFFNFIDNGYNSMLTASAFYCFGSSARLNLNFS